MNNPPVVVQFSYPYIIFEMENGQLLIGKTMLLPSLREHMKLLCLHPMYIKEDFLCFKAHDLEISLPILFNEINNAYFEQKNVDK